MVQEIAKKLIRMGKKERLRISTSFLGRRSTRFL